MPGNPIAEISCAITPVSSCPSFLDDSFQVNVLPEIALTLARESCIGLTPSFNLASELENAVISPVTSKSPVILIPVDRVSRTDVALVPK